MIVRIRGKIILELLECTRFLQGFEIPHALLLPERTEKTAVNFKNLWKSCTSKSFWINFPFKLEWNYVSFIHMKKRFCISWCYQIIYKIFYMISIASFLRELFAFKKEKKKTFFAKNFIRNIKLHIFVMF